MHSIDLVKITEESRLNREKREKRNAKIKEDLSIIKEMRGTLKFNLATPELSEVIEVSWMMVITWSQRNPNILMLCTETCCALQEGSWG